MACVAPVTDTKGQSRQVSQMGEATLTRILFSAAIQMMLCIIHFFPYFINFFLYQMRIISNVETAQTQTFLTSGMSFNNKLSTEAVFCNTPFGIGLLRY